VTDLAAWARKMNGWVDGRFDPYLRGVRTFEQCAVEAIERLVFRGKPDPAASFQDVRAREEMQAEESRRHRARQVCLERMRSRLRGGHNARQILNEELARLEADIAGTLPKERDDDG
jgi:acylphosphatase